jgi:hypothetical protein
MQENIKNSTKLKVYFLLLLTSHHKSLQYNYTTTMRILYLINSTIKIILLKKLKIHHNLIAFLKIHKMKIFLALQIFRITFLK